MLVLISASALAIAVGIDDLRRFHTLLFAFLTGVILVNLLTIVLLPAYAISDIGVRGFYPQKNVAGIVAMLAVFLGAAWTLGARSRTETWLGRFGIAVATLFLVLSRSKTSLGIAGAVLVVGGVLLIAERCAVRLIVLSSAVILTTAAAVMFAYDIDSLQLIGTLLNDTSFTGRDLLWKFIWNTASQRTWLGYGYGAFWDVGEANDPLNKAEPGTWLGDVEKGVINEAHNGYLELWVSVGLPAAIIAVLSIIVSVRNAAGHAMQLAVRSNERSMFAATVLILIAYLLHNITESTFFLRGSTFCNLALLLQMIATRAPQPDAVRPVGLRTTTP